MRAFEEVSKMLTFIVDKSCLEKVLTRGGGDEVKYIQEHADVVCESPLIVFLKSSCALLNSLSLNYGYDYKLLRV